MHIPFATPDKFGSDSSLWSGMVVDRADPQQRGRIRVRIFGHYSDTIPIDELPWANVLMPVTEAQIGGVGQAPVGLMLGSLVVGVFIDGKDKQIPLVLGTIGPVEGELLDGNGAITPYGVEQDLGKVPSDVTFTGDGPKWIQIARSEIGVKEYKGSRHNPRVLEYAKTNGFSDDETAWCSSFVKWCVKNAGYATTGVNGLARSWSRASCVEKLSEPVHGCIVVLTRGSNPAKGHVGFLDKIQGGRFMMIGGNQSDAVTRAGYKKSRLVGFYWPKGAPKDGNTIPTG